MKKLFLLVCFLYLIPVALHSSTATDYPLELKQLHQNVWDSLLSEKVNEEEVATQIRKLSADGTWPNIDYASKARGSWPPAKHVGRLLRIVRGYRQPGTVFYQNEALSGRIHQALDYWLANDFTSDNWWHTEIGTPRSLSAIMLLMEDELDEQQLKAGIAILNRAKLGMTGQNKIWLAGNVLFRSLLLRDAEMVEKAAADIRGELVVSLDEGVQPDWSYHQHGPQLQIGNYGLCYTEDMIRWISILRKTPFRFDESKLSILRNYLLEGQRWVLWQDQLDINACGRQLFKSSPTHKAESLQEFFPRMLRLDPEHAQAYRQAQEGVALTGNRHFWRSDFQVHRSRDFYASVKMSSSRVAGAESCNGENIQGYYMGDGATFLYRDGEAYRDIFPLWDWKKIPGTTTHQDEAPLPVLTWEGYRIESDFVGGVSDGEAGLAVLDYKRDGLSARKSWFFFDDKIVCLGAGIQSEMGYPVATCVNQSYIDGVVTVMESAGSERLHAPVSSEFVNPLWIEHDGITYLFPQGGRLRLETASVEGSWNRVSTQASDQPVSARVFKLWFDHGTSPDAASYAYVMLPGVSGADLAGQGEGAPFSIRNQRNRQEVVRADGKLAGIVFYEAGTSGVMGGVRTKQPALVLMRKEEDRLNLSVADPTQRLSELELSVSGEYQHAFGTPVDGKTLLRIPLPQGGMAGKSVCLSLTEPTR